jgi:hypothetical protein
MSIPPSQALSKMLVSLGFVAALSVPLHGQTIDDGVMMAKHALFTGNLYTHESRDEYWEGTLKRDNGNIGTLTTQTNSWFGNYGLTSRLNVLANVPYVWTSASQGVLRGMNGMQDLTLAGKYRLFERTSTSIGTLQGIGVVTGAIPLTDYTPDFYPLSIGSQSRRVSGRFTLNLHAASGLYINGSTAYTWRAHVTLDRPFYFTDGQLFMTDEVDMPGVFDYVASAGYLKRGLMATFSLSQQRTDGGGDIRRQDMPFVSNRMNFTRVGGMVMYPLPKLRPLVVQFSVAHTLDGRNVGQGTTFTTGFAYTFRFFGSATE